MRRREFIAGLGRAAAWPLAVRAQQQSLQVIGFLRLGSPDGLLTAFRRGLAEAGYVDGQNVTIEVRWANDNGQLRGLAEDLVRRQPAVIVASGSVVAIRVANAAASTVPIAFVIGIDPVEYGLVASLNRPGGTIMSVGGTPEWAWTTLAPGSKNSMRSQVRCAGNSIF
jgi:putative ABC transport system substrate-binding protein